MVIINEEKCIGCGLCAKDCPASRIRIQAGKAVWSGECIQVRPLCGGLSRKAVEYSGV